MMIKLYFMCHICGLSEIQFYNMFSLWGCNTINNDKQTIQTILLDIQIINSDKWGNQLDFRLELQVNPTGICVSWHLNIFKDYPCKSQKYLFIYWSLLCNKTWLLLLLLLFFFFDMTEDKQRQLLFPVWPWFRIGVWQYIFGYNQC